MSDDENIYRFNPGSHTAPSGSDTIKKERKKESILKLYLLWMEITTKW